MLHFGTIGSVRVLVLGTSRVFIFLLKVQTHLQLHTTLKALDVLQGRRWLKLASYSTTHQVDPHPRAPSPPPNLPNRAAPNTVERSALSPSISQPNTTSNTVAEHSQIGNIRHHRTQCTFTLDLPPVPPCWWNHCPSANGSFSSPLKTVNIHFRFHHFPPVLLR